jgi:transposase
MHSRQRLVARVSDLAMNPWRAADEPRAFVLASVSAMRYAPHRLGPSSACTRSTGSTAYLKSHHKLRIVKEINEAILIEVRA